MNLLEITAQDLLGKSHEELVLLLIHVRRQSAALGEAADVARAELERNPGSPDIRDRLRELEDRRARSRPIVSLVDNMVKLGSLYRGPGNAPLSHRIRNLPTSNAKESPPVAAAAAPAATANVATTFSGSVTKTSEESARLERRA